MLNRISHTGILGTGFMLVAVSFVLINQEPKLANRWDYNSKGFQM